VTGPKQGALALERTRAVDGMRLGFARILFSSARGESFYFIADLLPFAAPLPGILFREVGLGAGSIMIVQFLEHRNLL
jgi:hypothetical protein